MNIIVTIAYVAEWCLFAMAAFSVAYITIFALASHLPRCKSGSDDAAQPHFLIVIPAYAEDNVIMATVEAALRQTYAATDICVVSDHMSQQTNEWLARQPIRLTLATYTDSTKGKALQHAMTEAYIPERHSHVLVIDADNIIEHDLLARLAPLCIPGNTAIQLHRTAKNTDTPIAMLDAASEEINNSIFRRGHNNLGMTSALIGSGICFEAKWFAQAVQHLQSAGEDKELERQLLLDGHHTYYASFLPVYDEKVSNRANFSRQRRRWLAAQLWALGYMIRGLPRAFAAHSPALRLDYIDKTVQQALIPRSLLMLLTATMLVASLLLAAFGIASWCLFLRWLVLDVTLDVALIAAIPNHMRGPKLAAAATAMPALVWQMVLSLFRLRGASHKFIHTEHGQQ